MRDWAISLTVIALVLLSHVPQRFWKEVWSMWKELRGDLTVHEVVKRDDGSFTLFVNRKLHAETRSAMTNERIKLDPLVNQLVRFKLHELAETKNGVIRAFDEQGCLNTYQAKLMH